jgi:hypothetical protein
LSFCSFKLSLCSTDRGFEPDRVKQKTIELVFADCPLSTQH